MVQQSQESLINQDGVSRLDPATITQMQLPPTSQCSAPGASTRDVYCKLPN